MFSCRNHDASAFRQGLGNHQPPSVSRVSPPPATSTPAPPTAAAGLGQKIPTTSPPAPTATAAATAANATAAAAFPTAASAFRMKRGVVHLQFNTNHPDTMGKS